MMTILDPKIKWADLPTVTITNNQGHTVGQFYPGTLRYAGLGHVLTPGIDRYCLTAQQLKQLMDSVKDY